MPEQPPRLAVVIDYQNIHLTARDRYRTKTTPPEDVLIHPLRFANRLVQARAARQHDEWQKTAELTSVRVFRGSPGSAEEPFLYRVTQAQRAEWTRDHRVQVRYRKLKYSSKPGKRPEEKGIDVFVALTVVELAASGDFDVVVLAAHDTDLEPALEVAVTKGAKIETAGWDGCRVLRAPGQRLWHTVLTGVDMEQSIDKRQYP